jgi:hypothetical protein
VLPPARERAGWKPALRILHVGVVDGVLFTKKVNDLHRIVALPEEVAWEKRLFFLDTDRMSVLHWKKMRLITSRSILFLFAAVATELAQQTFKYICQE